MRPLVQRRVRWRPLAIAATVLAAWTGLQLWLAHRALRELDAQLAANHRKMNAFAVAQGRRFEIAPPRANPSSIWVHAGEQSFATALVISAIAMALILGGRRWSAALIVVAPLANVVGGFDLGSQLGTGWAQETSTQTWMTVGSFLDSAMLLVVVALLIRALPRRASSIPGAATTRPPAVAGETSVPGAVARGGFAAIVMFTWWVMRVDTSDPDHRIWIVQAMGFVLVAALLATARLSLAARLAMIALVLPLCSMLLTGDIIVAGLRRPTFDGPMFVHHALVAIAVAGYAAGVPALLARSRHRRAEVSTIGQTSTV